MGHLKVLFRVLCFFIYFNYLANIPQHNECIVYADSIVFGTLNETKELKSNLKLKSEVMEKKNLQHTKEKLK